MIHPALSNHWHQSEGWVACFDIMGFKEIARREDLFTTLLQDGVGELIAYIKNQSNYSSISYILISDTFIIYTHSNDLSGYDKITRISKRFIEKCIQLRIPVRGAISAGNIVRGHDNRCLMGDAFLESFEYCEDQNWIGLILTPKAIYRAKELDIHPSRHNFVCCPDVPMRSFERFKDEIMAYRLQDVRTNLEPWVLHYLRDMKDSFLNCASKHQEKYNNTINFVEAYQRRIETA